MKKELLTDAKKIWLSLRFDTISLNIQCKSEYEAASLLSELAERLRRGEPISLEK